MISHLVLTILGNPELIAASQAQRACQLFADYDFSIPRMINPELLEQHYEWPSGSARKLLAKLDELKVLAPFHGKPSAIKQGQPNAAVWMIAPGMGWTPRTLASQWARIEANTERMAQCLSRQSSEQ